MSRKTSSLLLLESFSQLPDCSAAMVNQSHKKVSAAEEMLGAQKGKGIQLRHAPNVALGEDF